MEWGMSLADIEESEIFDELVIIKLKEIDEDEGFEELDYFESNVWPDEMEDRTEKAYKQVILENVNHKDIHKCYTYTIGKVRLG